ncbi:UV DNA damage repair endonuclease UvsE [Clostridium thermosuccinogenes]|uniref:UV DNA damage repair endonuclease UvsE n=1 Tax=Clostridium thermosuccinogenes TaxID=84032 RepID=UPI000CCC6256|nr:UV DNA damage repair endonuclease UvsE [Pseudoclostridium thermosuccinogenes]PNT90452.1 UV damage endonuclease UvsE [Pseudoclostridium thermosuccinogenes]
MIIRLGYVAMTLNLHDCSPSSTVTVTAFKKLDEEAGKFRLKKLTLKNLENTRRILLYNQAMNIKLYRFTSKLVPLATHPLIEGWDYAEDFREEFRKIGDLVKVNDFRVSAHPDHFTIINSPSEDVFNDAVKDLDYHVKIYEAMGLEDYKYKLVLHVGGLYKDKKSSLERFKKNFESLPDRIRRRIIIENDDKSYSAYDVLELCRELKTPMVLDVHHHKCVNNGEKLEDMLEEIFSTWDNEAFPPKIHFSSPKSEKDFRSHADNIDINEFTEFLEIAKKTGRDFDVMLEAKNKDSALLKLSEELEGCPGIRRINNGEFEII